jgi:hypothetical protein
VWLLSNSSSHELGQLALVAGLGVVIFFSLRWLGRPVASGSREAGKEIASVELEGN